jgi:hypothetical protein
MEPGLMFEPGSGGVNWGVITGGAGGAAWAAILGGGAGMLGMGGNGAGDWLCCSGFIFINFHLLLSYKMPPSTLRTPLLH